MNRNKLYTIHAPEVECISKALFSRAAIVGFRSFTAMGGVVCRSIRDTLTRGMKKTGTAT